MNVEDSNLSVLLFAFVYLKTLALNQSYMRYEKNNLNPEINLPVVNGWKAYNHVLVVIQPLAHWCRLQLTIVLFSRVLIVLYNQVLKILGSETKLQVAENLNFLAQCFKG